MPPIKVRARASVQEQPFLTSIPVYSYLSKNTPEDDITPGGCPYTNSYNGDHWNKESTYESVADFILPILREPVGKAFGKTQAESKNLTMVELYEFSDVLLAENMEGMPPRYNFTSMEWHYIRTVQKLILLMPISDFARDLWITK